MSKQFSTLFTPISELSDEQLRAHIEEVRRKKYIERPAAKKRAEAKEKKEAAPKKAKVKNLIDALSAEERVALIASLSSGD